MEENKNLVMSYNRMRRWVGYLGLGLPFALLIGDWLFHTLKIYQNPSLMQMCVFDYNSTNHTRDSISEYFYTPMGELFVGTLSAVAFFLFLYKGYENKEGEFMPSDGFITNFAGICALLVAIFPMDVAHCTADNFRTFISHKPVGYIHYGAAVLFFISLAVMCLVNFRRADTLENFGKLPPHNFFKGCGIGILASLVAILLFKVVPFLNAWADEIDFEYLFWFETTSLLFFGASWLKKGKVENLLIIK
jgi:hypothetical protein